MVSSYPLSLFLTLPFFLPLFGKAPPKATLSRRETMTPGLRLVHLDVAQSATFSSGLEPGWEFHREGQEPCYFWFVPGNHQRNVLFPIFSLHSWIDWKHWRETERETSLITKICLSWNPNKFSFKKLRMWFPWQEAEFTWRAHVLNDGDDFFVLYLRRVLEARLEC